MLQNLIFDKRFRSISFQIFLFLFVIFLFYWFAQNASNNITARGDKFGFDFLNNSSGFSILPTLGTWLMDYEVGKSTYLDVYFIGIINTLVIAFTGVIATTLLGFLIGIFRLSNNIVLKFFSSVYVEMFRNIPLLIHLFFWYFAVLRAVPGKREKIDVLGSYAGINVTGLYIPKPLFFDGSTIFLFSILFSIALAFFMTSYTNNLRIKTGQQLPLFQINLGIIFLIPTFVFLFLTYQSGAPLEFQIPEFKTDGPKLKQGFVKGIGMSVHPEMIALWLALVLYTAAFIAEIVRAGITAIHKGQTEASLATGMTKSNTLRLIIIPQALRVIVPPLTSQYLNLTKNSSLAVAIAYPELVSVFAGTALNQVGREVEMIFMMALVYLTFSLITSLFMNWFNHRIKLVEK
jgi:general L-amino acid transport system permease protein